MIHTMYGLPASGKITFAMELFEKYKCGEVLEPSQKYRNL